MLACRLLGELHIQRERQNDHQCYCKPFSGRHQPLGNHLTIGFHRQNLLGSRGLWAQERRSTSLKIVSCKPTMSQAHQRAKEEIHRSQSPPLDTSTVQNYHAFYPSHRVKSWQGRNDSNSLVGLHTKYIVSRICSWFRLEGAWVQHIKVG